ncbi:gluconeogenesis factor YvcK family protein [Deinococcus hohokamensis]|uniref:Putative gluconeogenesis factor n=1 Tax=Deinococcus hohokamensis TaxID=309883 RepID=A0ABV9IAT4_9DEIO
MSDPPLVRAQVVRARTEPAQGARRQTRRARMWLEPGIGVKRWVMLFVVCTLIGAVGFLHFTWTGPLHFTATKWILWVNHFLRPEFMPLYLGGMIIMALALLGALWSIAMLGRSVLRGTGTAPGAAVDMIYARHTLGRAPRVVALGGGTGLSNLLQGLREITGNTTAVVAISDDGGSSGRLRRSLDMIAPGDLTDCYAALSDSPVMARLMLHRFGRGDGIEGHTFGNLMLATLSEEEGGLGAAMQDIHEVLRIRGHVYPATLHPATLVAQLSDGRVIRGESRFADEIGQARIQQVRLDPPNLPAMSAIPRALEEAELIVLGPGSLYTSIIPALLVPEIAVGIRNSPAPLVYIASLMTEPGETDGLTLEDHVGAIVRHLGRTPDHILVNSAVPPQTVLDRYAAQGAHLLDLHCESHDLRERMRSLPLLQDGQARHDPHALAQALLNYTLRRQP